MEKLLTVSVAAYNGAATLQKALSSCLVADESLQALLDVIIIDDGSTDGTAALAQAFRTRPTRGEQLLERAWLLGQRLGLPAQLARGRQAGWGGAAAVNASAGCAAWPCCRRQCRP